MQSGDPWGGAGAPTNGTGPPKGIDDEFDLLSSRSKSPQTTGDDCDELADLFSGIGSISSSGGGIGGRGGTTNSLASASQ